MILKDTTGRAATMELFITENPDGVIADKMVPKLNGFHVCEEIWQY
jgi:DNA-binding response OmpR family regulator